MKCKHDVLIAGAGLVGLASAYQLLVKRPGMRVAVVEKEERSAVHQSGRNSGVVHSGIYYKPNSLKANYCRSGRAQLLKFCEEKNIPCRKIHKIILAKTKDQGLFLEELLKRAQANQVMGVERIGPERLGEIEPFAFPGEALLIPHCYILDYRRVAQSLEEEIVHRGGEVLFSHQVVSFSSQENCLRVETSQQTLSSHFFVNCAGLFSDLLAKRYFGFVEERIIPFRGEYYLLSPRAAQKIQGLIYPVPDPRFPFLGVHLTPMVHGAVEAGPNAVLALAREGYRKRDVDWKEVQRFISYVGFWKMASRYFRVGAYEMARSLSKKLFLRDVQALCPSLVGEDLCPGGAGIRAQVVKRDGSLMDDFAIMEDRHSVHVINAPSPAATSCLGLGQMIAEKILRDCDKIK